MKVIVGRDNPPVERPEDVADGGELPNDAVEEEPGIKTEIPNPTHGQPSPTLTSTPDDEGNMRLIGKSFKSCESHGVDLLTAVFRRY